nr:MAG TPA: hypothetical protein [Caudoviricetes sp.]
MSSDKLKLPARHRKPVTGGGRQNLWVKPEAYNAVLSVTDETTLSMNDVASRMLLFAAEHVEFIREEK